MPPPGKISGRQGSRILRVLLDADYSKTRRRIQAVRGLEVERVEAPPASRMSLAGNGVIPVRAGLLRGFLIASINKRVDVCRV